MIDLEIGQETRKTKEITIHFSKESRFEDTTTLIRISTTKRFKIIYDKSIRDYTGYFDNKRVVRGSKENVESILATIVKKEFRKNPNVLVY